MNEADYALVNLGTCIKGQADRLGIEHEGVPLEGVVVRIAEAALSRAAASEPLHESPAIQAARDVLDGLEPWEIHNRAREEMQSALDDIPCCESATAMVHAEDHGAPEPEWEYAVEAPGANGVGTQRFEFPDRLAAERFVKNGALWYTPRANGNPKILVRRRPAGPWEPVEAGGEGDVE